MTPSDPQIHHFKNLIKGIVHHPDVTFSQPSAEDFAEVVIILGASRSGSSLLFHALSESGSFLCPHGEETPLYRALGLGFVDSLKQSDILSSLVGEPLKKELRELLYFDLGKKEANATVNPRLIAQLVLRLCLQWSNLSIPIDEMFAKVAKALGQKENPWFKLLTELKLHTDFY